MEEIIELIKSGKNNLLAQKLKADPSLADAKNNEGTSLLQFAAYCRNNSALEIIEQYKKNYDVFEAATIGKTETVIQSVNENFVLLNSYSLDGFTVLGLASFFGHLSLVKLLLEKGSDPNIASNNLFKVAPLHSACANSRFDIAELLLKHGANVNAKQMNGVTALHSAAHNGQTKLAKLLIENGADINAKTDIGQTPLAIANEKNQTEIAEFLISSGASK